MRIAQTIALPLLTFLLFLASASSVKAQCLPTTFEEYSGLNPIVICDDTGPTRYCFRPSETGVFYTFVIVDENDVIVTNFYRRCFDFSTLPAGNYKVYGVSFLLSFDAQPGDPFFDTELAGWCYIISDNFVEVNVLGSGASQGTISLQSGAVDTSVCVGDGNADILGFSFDGTTGGFDVQYIITDENNQITSFVNGDTEDFESTGTGEARVFAVVSPDTLNLQIGDVLDSTALAGTCASTSTNFVTVNRAEAEGGQVQIQGSGSTDTLTCTNDGIDDIILVEALNAAGLEYTFVITDEQNVILDLPAGNALNFEGADPGICRIWGLSYTGQILAQVGDTASAIDLTDACFDLSDNFITVNRQFVDGGTITTDGGQTNLQTCPGDTIGSLLAFQVNTSASMADTALVLTDTNNVILDIVTNGNSLDLSGFGSGTYRVWAVSFTGTFTGMIGDNAALVSLSDGCFDLSDNFVTIERIEVNGGTVAELGTGATEIFTCTNDGIPDTIVPTVFDTLPGFDFTYVITDEQNVILELPTGNVLDFDNAPAGVCRVWGLSFTGQVTAQVGDTANLVPLTDGCFDLSDNFITVVRQYVEGGMVSTVDGALEVFLCVGDSVPNVLEYFSDTDSNEDYVFLITDADNVLLELDTTGSFDFEDAMVGVCRIWGVSYTGNLLLDVGDAVGVGPLSDDCFDLSDNFINVIRTQPEAGSLMTADNMQVVFTCPGDTLADLISVVPMSPASAPYVFIITDEQGIILDITTDNPIDFGNADPGTCLIWGLSYTGNLLAQVGDNALQIDLSDDCYDLTDIPVEVIREEPEAGTVELNNGNTSTFVCAADGEPDVLNFSQVGAGPAPAVFLITDAQDTILEVLIDTAAYDFEGSGEGVCRVWALSYTGNLLAASGQWAPGVPLSDDCFDLSDNFITVTKETPVGGSVQLVGGGDTATICAGDGLSDVIKYESSGASGTGFTFLIADTMGTIIFPLSLDSIDLENALADDEWRLYGLSFTGTFLGFPGDNINTSPLSNRCYDLSENFITLRFEKVDGGVLFIPGDNSTDTTLCPGAGEPDIVAFQSSNLGNVAYEFIITDTNNVVLDITDQPFYDFGGTGFETLRVWGVSFSGTLLIQPGDTVGISLLTDGCGSLSQNFISIFKDSPSAGTIATASGDSSFVFCVGDASADIVSFSNTSSGMNADYAYILTDTFNQFVQVLNGNEVNFNTLTSAGVFRVWGLSFTGDVVIVPGQSVVDNPVTDDCWDISSNFVTISTNYVDGGVVTGQFGINEFYACLGDGEPDLLGLNTTSNATTANYTFIITNENNGFVNIVNGDLQDFEGMDTGVQRVWGVSHVGPLTVSAGADVTDISLSDECFELSATFVTVFKDSVEAGLVFTQSGDSAVTVCPGDGNPDFVFFQNTGMGTGEYRYVVTDASDNILLITSANNANFENAGVGSSKVFGLSFTGTLEPNLPGQDIFQAVFSDGCFVLSDNFISVTQVNPEAGTIATNDGQTLLAICVLDGDSDSLKFELTGATPTAEIVYVITDEDENILQIYNTNTIEFDTFLPGEYLVWAIAYTGNLLVGPGDNLDGGPLSDDCFDLSGNNVNIVAFSAGGPCGPLVPPNPTSLNGAEGTRILIHPNPAMDRTRISWYQSEAGDVRMMLLDFNGQPQRVEQLFGVESGWQEREWQLDQLPAGIYMLVIEQEDGTWLRKKVIKAEVRR